MKHATEMDTFCGCLRIKQRYEAGYKKSKSAQLQARRVKTAEDGEHVQIELYIANHSEKRTNEAHFSLSLSPKETEALITALTKLHPPHKDVGYVPASIERKQWEEFYGLEA